MMSVGETIVNRMQLTESFVLLRTPLPAAMPVG